MRRTGWSCAEPLDELIPECRQPELVILFLHPLDARARFRASLNKWKRLESKNTWRPLLGGGKSGTCHVFLARLFVDHLGHLTLWDVGLVGDGVPSAV